MLELVISLILDTYFDNNKKNLLIYYGLLGEWTFLGE